MIALIILIIIIIKLTQIPFQDDLWLSCKYPRLVTVNVGVESKRNEIRYEHDSGLQYEASTRLDSTNGRTFVSFHPKHQLKLIPK